MSNDAFFVLNDSPFEAGRYPEIYERADSPVLYPYFIPEVWVRNIREGRAYGLEVREGFGFGSEVEGSR